RSRTMTQPTMPAMKWFPIRSAGNQSRCWRRRNRRLRSRGMTASARGLFRATGKVSKPVAVAAGDDLLGPVKVAQYLEREKDDFYPTPPEPTRAFLHAEIDRLRDFGII